MSKRVKLNNVRISYANVFKARAMNEGQEPRYSAQIIIDKDDDQVATYEKAILDVAKEKFAKLIKGDKLPAKIMKPLRDGDEERDEDDNYVGKYFFNASNKRRPTVIDRDKTPLTEEDGVIYSGCYVNVIIDLFAYDTAGNKGVSASLMGVQFKDDGDALGGAPNVTADDFDSEEDDEYDI